MGCSCGESKPHKVAMRSTSDGKHVHLWSDGWLTWALGAAIKGAPQPRTEAARQEALAAGWLVLGEVELYDAAEIRELIGAARWAVKRNGGRPLMMRRLLGQRAGKIQPRWETYQTDRDGRPVLQVWRLPRLAFGPLCVWRERGIYEVLRGVPGAPETVESTGFKARNLDELAQILDSLRIKEVM